MTESADTISKSDASQDRLVSGKKCSLLLLAHLEDKAVLKERNLSRDAFTKAINAHVHTVLEEMLAKFENPISVKTIGEVLLDRKDLPDKVKFFDKLSHLELPYLSSPKLALEQKIIAIDSFFQTMVKGKRKVPKNVGKNSPSVVCLRALLEGYVVLLFEKIAQEVEEEDWKKWVSNALEKMDEWEIVIKKANINTSAKRKRKPSVRKRKNRPRKKRKKKKKKPAPS